VLPIVEYQQEIIEKITQAPVLFISGTTGCGKSTQVEFDSFFSSFSFNPQKKKKTQ